MLSNHTCIRKEDIQSPIPLHRICYDTLDCLFVCSVELSCMNVARRVQRLQLSLMCLEVLRVEVADVYSFCAILGELMC